MIQLLAEPLLARLTAGAREHLDRERDHQYIGQIDEYQLAQALLPAVAAHTAEVLGRLASGHDRRAAGVIGDSRGANTLRAAHEDAARTVRALANYYAGAES